jgi:predicted outer membrane protein
VTLRKREDAAELNATLLNETKKAGVGFVSPESLSNKKGDAAHFDARSLREFGRRFAKVMAATRRESDRSELQHRK